MKLLHNAITLQCERERAFLSEDAIVDSVTEAIGMFAVTPQDALIPFHSPSMALKMYHFHIYIFF